MSLVSGTKLGPYEILAPLGAGGMGEVYRARNARLDGTVAIKILPGEGLKDAEETALRARSQDHLQPESSAHLRFIRHRFPGWRGLLGDGVRGRRDAGQAAREGTAAARASLEVRRADCRRARPGPSSRDC